MGKAGFPPTCPGVLGLLGSEQQSGGQQSVAVLSLELEEAWGPVVSFAAPVPGGAGGGANQSQLALCMAPLASPTRTPPQGACPLPFTVCVVPSHFGATVAVTERNT